MLFGRLITKSLSKHISRLPQSYLVRWLLTIYNIIDCSGALQWIQAIRSLEDGTKI